MTQPHKDLINGCTNCGHFQLREMIKKPYGYAGEIPCFTCSRYQIIEDRHTNANNSKLTGGQ